jgi:plastocyanin domain-containing protein
MKTHSIFLTLFLLVIATVNASAQCGMMGSHKHSSSEDSQHKHEQQATASKANAFINEEGKQEATIVVKGGYLPKTIVAKKGIPLRLNFDLQEKSCTGTVVFKDFDVEQELTPFKITVVEFTPDRSGSFTFSCPMDMIQGTLLVTK